MATYGYLAHHGVKGQKWGVRRYENPDGTLTEAGKKRYSYDRARRLDTVKTLTGFGGFIGASLTATAIAALNPAAALPLGAITATLIAVSSLSKKEVNNIAMKSDKKVFKKIARDDFLYDYKGVKKRSETAFEKVPDKDREAFNSSKEWEEMDKEANRLAVQAYKRNATAEEWNNFQKYVKKNNIPFDDYYLYNNDIDTYKDGYNEDPELEDKYYKKWKTNN